MSAAMPVSRATEDISKRQDFLTECTKLTGVQQTAHEVEQHDRVVGVVQTRLRTRSAVIPKPTAAHPLEHRRCALGSVDASLGAQSHMRRGPKESCTLTASRMAALCLMSTLSFTP